MFRGWGAEPDRMGYLGVKTLASHISAKVEKRIDTGVAMVTKENMGEPEIQELLNPPLEEYLAKELSPTHCACAFVAWPSASARRWHSAAESRGGSR